MYEGFWILKHMYFIVSLIEVIKPENFIPMSFLVSMTGYENSPVADVLTESVLLEFFVFRSKLL